MDKIKIAIVEDDPDIVDLYAAGLDDNTFDKRFAGNGEDALELYSSWKPDIMILDIMLPLMTGYSVLREIRTTLKDRSTTIIMSTSLNRNEDIQDCMALGIQGYIVKPFKVDELGSRIITYFRHHKNSLPRYD